MQQDRQRPSNRSASATLKERPQSRALELSRAEPLSAAQQERLIHLLSAGLSRYLRSRSTAGLDSRGAVCVYTDDAAAYRAGDG